MAATATDLLLKTILLDIAKEEKTHIGEFQAVLLKKDNQQLLELAKGEQEIKDLSK